MQNPKDYKLLTFNIDVDKILDHISNSTVGIIEHSQRTVMEFILEYVKHPVK